MELLSDPSAKYITSFLSFDKSQPSENSVDSSDLEPVERERARDPSQSDSQDIRVIRVSPEATRV
jgi:hypothetical protein